MRRQSRGSPPRARAAMLIAGPNLTIDRTLTLGELRPGEVLRFDSAVVTPGGKGVNVVRAATALGGDAVLVGVVPGHTGAAVAAMLAHEGVALAGIEVGGEVRSSAIVLERSGRVTVMNEPGPELRAEDWERYAAAVQQRLAEHDVLACSGSLPPGAPEDAYAQRAAAAVAAGATAIVDVTGERLGAAVAGGAAIVTPNLAEAEGMLHGRADETVEAGDPEEVRGRACAAAAALVAGGARGALVTAGRPRGGGGGGGGRGARHGGRRRRGGGRARRRDDLAAGAARDGAQPGGRRRRARRRARRGARARGAARAGGALRGRRRRRQRGDRYGGNARRRPRRGAAGRDRARRLTTLSTLGYGP